MFKLCREDKLPQWNCRRTASTVSAVSDGINASGGRALGLTCDVADEAQVKALVSRTVDEFGTVNVLVNCAQSFGRAGDPRAIAGDRAAAVAGGVDHARSRYRIECAGIVFAGVGAQEASDAQYDAR